MKRLVEAASLSFASREISVPETRLPCHTESTQENNPKSHVFGFPAGWKASAG